MLYNIPKCLIISSSVGVLRTAQIQWKSVIYLERLLNQRLKALVSQTFPYFSLILKITKVFFYTLLLDILIVSKSDDK